MYAFVTKYVRLLTKKERLLTKCVRLITRNVRFKFQKRQSINYFRHSKTINLLKHLKHIIKNIKTVDCLIDLYILGVFLKTIPPIIIFVFD